VRGWAAQVTAGPRWEAQATAARGWAAQAMAAGLRQLRGSGDCEAALGDGGAKLG
jgi:hypothetical protein